MQFDQLGPYRIGRKIGQGGMGAVYEAVDLQTGEPAAVKVLSPVLAGEEGFRVRFEAEIESLKKLRHPNIVRLYGYGEQDEYLFYAMELVDGTSLEDELRAGRRFHWREVTQIAIKLCRALKHAHDHGVVHRDIKPANLLLASDGEVKLSDFGIARLFGNSRLTSDGGVLGTAEYMAPEQADSRPVTERCDQYSLGGVMYALLAGRPPFRAGTLLEMLQLQRFAEPQPVRRYAPEAPAELERIISQLLAKEPQKRFANALLVARALEAMQRGLSVSGERDDFIVATPLERTPDLTGFDPYAITLVPSETGQDAPPVDDDEENESDEPTLASAAPQIIAPPARPATEPNKSGRFIKIEPASSEQRASVREALQGLVSPQTLALAIGLVVVGGFLWYALQPPSADRLYEQIRVHADGDKPEDLLQAEEPVAAFLARYPNDPRSDEVQSYQNEIELLQQDRRSRRNARWLSKGELRSPVERAYVEAIRYAQLDPEEALARFQAIINLYDDPELSSETTRHYVELARRQLTAIRQQWSKHTADDLQLIRSRLEHANAIRDSEPEAARRIWRGIIELYGDKAWAAEVVRTAKIGLESLAEDASSSAAEARPAEEPGSEPSDPDATNSAVESDAPPELEDKG